MSGGVPKRVLISKTQSNTPSKAGRWGKPGIILCSGARSRRPMCNSIQTRAKYCAVPCTPPVPLNLLLFNTFNDASHNQGNLNPGFPAGNLDTVITMYYLEAGQTYVPPAEPTCWPPCVKDDTGNVPTTYVPAPSGPIPVIWNIPQNYAVYDDAVYQDIFSQSYSAADINIADLNGGDKIRFIVSTLTGFVNASGVAPPNTTLPLWTTPTTTSGDPPPTGMVLGDALNPRVQFNYGIASQMPPNSELNKLQIPPTPPTGFTTGTAVLPFITEPNPMYYLTVDVTLSADKKTVTHTIV